MTIKVFAHDSGQRLNWAYARELVELDRAQWLEEIARYNHMPLQCVGAVIEVELSLVDRDDVYLG